MLGESFHVDTIAHLLQPIVAQMPKIPVILSLCDGIGAAKLALKRCGGTHSSVFSPDFLDWCPLTLHACEQCNAVCILQSK